MARGILVPWPEIEPASSAVRAWSPNHWTTREFSVSISFARNIHSIVVREHTLYDISLLKPQSQLFGTGDCFHGRQLFHSWGWGEVGGG